jgi:hypothetical protein
LSLFPGDRPARLPGGGRCQVDGNSDAVRGLSRTTKVLFTSGYPAPNYRKSVAGDADVAFVTKPWTVSDLLTQIRAMLDAQEER